MAEPNSSFATAAHTDAIDRKVRLNTIRTSKPVASAITTGAIPRLPSVVSPRASRAASEPDVITLVVVGDTGFGGSMQPVSAIGGRRHGQK
ncbi:MAG: hypothetical protein AAFY64_05440, partial [Pseudomonadota bacterium]